MNGNEKKIKVNEYEEFLEKKLRVDLKDIEEVLKTKFDKYRRWEELKEIVKLWRRLENRDVNLQVPIGYGIHVNAETIEYDKVFVDVGLGCFLVMNYEEADKYSDIRMRVLKKEIDHYRSLAVQVKVKIKLTLLALNELNCDTRK